MSLCKLGTILSKVNETEQAILQRAVQDRDEYSAKDISHAINKVDEGYLKDVYIGATTVKEHRAQKCGCYDSR